MKTKKWKIIFVGILVVSVVVVSVVLKAMSTTTDEVKVTKETKVEKGNIIAGVTESGSITVGSNSMNYELDISTNSSSSSSSSNSSSSSTSGKSGSSEDQISGDTGMSNINPFQTSSSTTNSSSSSSSVTEGSLVVDTVSVAVGQTVATGDVLMTLTKDSVDAARKILKNGVSSAKLALTEAKVTDKQIKITAESEYNLNVAQGKKAKAVYNAAIESIESNISSLKEQISSTTDSGRLKNLKAQLTQALSEKDSKKLEAKQTYELAVMNYENAQSIYDVAMAEYGTATKEAEDALEDANEKLSAFEEFVGSDNTIHSTYDGSIVAIGYAAGDTLSNDTAIAQFADISSVTLSVNVTQDDISAVNIDDEVYVSFISDRETEYKGTVTAIGSAVTTSSTVSYPITITLSSMPEKVLNGMTASATFISKEVKDVLYVSNKAIYTEETKSYVTLKNDSGVGVKTEVTTGFSNGENVEISSGLTEGDTVLIESKVNNQ